MIGMKCCRGEIREIITWTT